MSEPIEDTTHIAYLSTDITVYFAGDKVKGISLDGGATGDSLVFEESENSREVEPTTEQLNALWDAIRFATVKVAS